MGDLACRRRRCHNSPYTASRRKTGMIQDVSWDLGNLGSECSVHQGDTCINRLLWSHGAALKLILWWPSLSAGWLSDRAAGVCISSPPVREHYLGSSDAHQTCSKHPTPLRGGVFGPGKLTKCYMKKTPQAECSADLEASNCFSPLLSQSACCHSHCQGIW